MKKLSMMVVFGVLASVVACAAPAEEETGADTGEALSASVCKPKADKAKQASIDACTANSKAEWTKCMAPADQAMAQYNARVSAAYQSVKSQVDEITGRCKADVDGMSAHALVADAYPSSSDFAKAAMEGNATEVANLKKAREAQCDIDAAPQLEATLGPGNAYQNALNEKIGQWASYALHYTGCAAESFFAGSCDGMDAYNNTYGTCRKQCPTPSQAACVPSDYGTRNVKCGKMVPNKSWLTGNCDSATICQRTSVCDDFDKQHDSAGAACVDPSTNKQGALVATVFVQPNGPALRSALVCRTP